MTTAPAICLDRVSWTYDGSRTPALDQIDLAIAPGETVVLAGASGSGKSTALRLMNGLIPHLYDGTLTGDARVLGAGIDTTDLARLGACTGSVWQHPFRQFFTAGVCEEIAFAMENRAVPPERIRRRTAGLVHEHGLAPLQSRRLSLLSSGEQQRVATVAAIAHRPSLLLLDEPTANLSAAAATELVGTLDRLRGEGITIVIAEHRIHPFVALADRIIRLHRGRVDTTWSPEQFARLTDIELRSHGLRPRTAPTGRSTPGVAAGPSIATAPIAAPRRPETTQDRVAGHGVRLEDVQCVREGRVVLDVRHAHFPAGRVTALRGPNGAGKTTLARVLAGLQRHRGAVTIDGVPASRAQRRGRTMLITQEVQRQLFAHTVRAELDLAAVGHPPAADAASLLARLGLDHLDERHPLSLSGGEQQRLAIAVARLSNRPIVILDEPSTGVDAQHLDTVSTLITGLAAAGRSVVIISHDDHLIGLTADVEIMLEPPVASHRWAQRDSNP